MKDFKQGWFTGVWVGVIVTSFCWCFILDAGTARALELDCEKDLLVSPSFVVNRSTDELVKILRMDIDTEAKHIARGELRKRRGE